MKNYSNAIEAAGGVSPIWSIHMDNIQELLVQRTLFLDLTRFKWNSIENKSLFHL